MQSRILASFPFTAYSCMWELLEFKSEINANIYVYICKIFTHEASMLSISWATLGLLCLLPTPFCPMVEMQDGRVCGYVNFVSYHVGNKRKTCSNRTFCDKSPDAKIRNIWGLNHNCSDWSHLLVGIVKSLKSNMYFHNCVSQSNAFILQVPASLILCLPQISGWSI